VDESAEIERLFVTRYASLRRLAALLLDDPGACEEVVQEAFVCLHARWSRLDDPTKALAYLRRTVVNLSRSRLRRRFVVRRHPAAPDPQGGDAFDGAVAALEAAAVVRALRGLQRRQREVLVLRYYAGLNEAEIAATLGVSAGSVKAYASRGLAALKEAFEEV
jgi:RNA polymerase sigma-70 factor (sigma-E family)